jgi:hypothetical protein
METDTKETFLNEPVCSAGGPSLIELTRMVKAGIEPQHCHLCRRIFYQMQHFQKDEFLIRDVKEGLKEKPE